MMGTQKFEYSELEKRINIWLNITVQNVKSRSKMKNTCKMVQQKAIVMIVFCLMWFGRFGHFVIFIYVFGCKCREQQDIERLSVVSANGHTTKNCSEYI